MSWVSAACGGSRVPAGVKVRLRVAPRGGVSQPHKCLSLQPFPVCDPYHPPGWGTRGEGRHLSSTGLHICKSVTPMSTEWLQGQNGSCPPSSSLSFGTLVIVTVCTYSHQVQLLWLALMLTHGSPTVMNGSSHSPTAIHGAPSTPNGFSNGPATSSTASLSTQHLPPACGARQLSKLKRFLTTLQQFGSDISPEIGERVRTLVMGLVVSLRAMRHPCSP